MSGRLNALAGASSPYLRQHATNPVDWLPWGPAAFARARALDRPIFLSIGYSTCHWCHVMARESFEDAGVAELLNAGFVSIKLDREERPDVDRVYMAYVQALTGRGGWPLSAWLTPDLRPFYAGTYFPPVDRQGRAGLSTILRAITRGWSEDRARLVAEADRVVDALRANARAPEPGDPTAAPTLAEAAAEAFERGLGYYADLSDHARGGFGGAPKFPRPANLEFLLRCAAIQGVDGDTGREALAMVTGTLGAMARGGIHDHVGGGLHRYSVDEDWFVPHFEKMLYDQAQVASAALGAWVATADERHAWFAGDLLDYVLSDLASPGGGFCSGEDADSDTAAGGHAEGAFYVWQARELEEALGPSDYPLFARHFGVLPAGNVAADRDPQREFAGVNILAQSAPLAATARAAGLDPETASTRLVAGLALLRYRRARRPRPARDDKVITAWNGLAISALARAAVLPASALDDRRGTYLSAAGRAADFLDSALVDPAQGSLCRSWCAGVLSGPAVAEDYACLVQGLLDLYEATFEVRRLDRAIALQHAMDALFWDPIEGGYFNSAEGAADVIVRLKEDYDGAEPAPGSVAALNLLRLSDLAGDESMRARARQVLAALRPRWQETPHALPQLLCALEPALEPPRHAILTGDPASPAARDLLAVLRSTPGPRRTLVALDAPGARAWFAARAPAIDAPAAVAGAPAIHLCEAGACLPPLSTPGALRAVIAPSRIADTGGLG